MAKKEVVWSVRAQQDRLEILEYWINRNKSKSYSEKLYRLFNTSVELLAERPEIGKSTDLKDVRIKVIREYRLIYQHSVDRIEILTIWDSRRNPDKLSNRLKRSR